MIELKKAVISGCTGTIGVALVNHLTAQGVKCILINVPEYLVKEVYLRQDMITYIDASLDEYLALSERDDLPNDCDAFFHLAWAGAFGPRRDDVMLQVKNVEGLVNAVNLAKKMGCKAFVGAGSQAEYGAGVEKEPHMLAPITGYGMAKLAGGQLGRLRASQLDMRFNWTRIFSVFGPNQSAGSLTQYVVESLLRGESPKLTPCEQIWDFLYTEDAVDALIAIAKSGVDGKTYELGSGETGTLRSFIEKVPGYLGLDTPILFGAIPYPENQIMKMCANVTSLMNDTGWKPKHTFKDGILAIAESVRNRK